MSRRVLEIETLAAFDAHIRRARSLNGWFVSSLDLTERSEALLGVDPRGRGLPGLPVQPGGRGSAAARPARCSSPGCRTCRSTRTGPRLYDADELYGAGPVPSDSPRRRDLRLGPLGRRPGRCPARWPPPCTTTRSPTPSTTRPTPIDPRGVVGIMGGHALLRTDPAYADAARLAAALTAAGRIVLTGGGPGAMEAGNLGAYLSPWPDALPTRRWPCWRPRRLPPGPRRLGAPSAYRCGTAGRPPRPARSLSIPTWFYGHEPSNLFATGIAKYFANALREDTLLHRCRGGIVYLARPGRHGAGDLPGGDRELLRRRRAPRSPR